MNKITNKGHNKLRYGSWDTKNVRVIAAPIDAQADAKGFYEFVLKNNHFETKK
jgi:hypothetical protein